MTPTLFKRRKSNLPIVLDGFLDKDVAALPRGGQRNGKRGASQLTGNQHGAPLPQIFISDQVWWSNNCDRCGGSSRRQRYLLCCNHRFRHPPDLATQRSADSALHMEYMIF